MTYTDIQAKFVKNWFKDTLRFAWEETEDAFVLTDTGYLAYIIPKPFMVLTKETLLKKTTPCKLMSCIGSVDDYSPAIITGTVFSKGKTLVKVENKKATAYFDSKLFKEYTNPAFTYRIAAYNKMVLVYLDKHLYAIVCPMIPPKEN